jgi:hypothetical protein
MHITSKKLEGDSNSLKESAGRGSGKRREDL